MSTRPCRPAAAAAARTCRDAFIGALLLALPFGLSHALESDRNQPLDITADYQHTALAESRDRAGVTELRGNVRMSQGSLRVSAARAMVYQHPASAKDAQGGALAGGVQRIVLSGTPARLQEQQDNAQGLLSAEARQIDYDADTGVARLSGGVSVVQQGRGEFHGENMIYNTRSGEIESGAEGSGSRVHLILQPRGTAAKPAAGAAEQPAGASSDDAGAR